MLMLLFILLSWNEVIDIWCQSNIQPVWNIWLQSLEVHGKWSQARKQASKQISTPAYTVYVVPLVWGSVRLTPTTLITVYTCLLITTRYMHAHNATHADHVKNNFVGFLWQHVTGIKRIVKRGKSVWDKFEELANSWLLTSLPTIILSYPLPSFI